MATRIRRIDVRAGYDRWARIYDRRPTALVALDRRATLGHLKIAPGERVLDAGCGTGAHVEALRALGARPVGLDLSLGMLARARARGANLSLAQTDLNHPLPLESSVFDAVLCSLVSEHLSDLRTFFQSALGVLRVGGRMVFAAFHPDMAAAGVEASFELDDTEYRLGAEPHRLEDYLEHMSVAGFEAIRWCDYVVDQDLVEQTPSAAKHLGKRLLLIIEARRPG